MRYKFILLFIILASLSAPVVFAADTTIDMSMGVTADKQQAKTQHSLNPLLNVIKGFQLKVTATVRMINNEIKVPDYEPMNNTFQYLYNPNVGGGALLPNQLRSSFQLPPNDDANKAEPQIVGKHCNPSNFPLASGNIFATDKPMIVGDSDDGQKGIKNYLAYGYLHAAITGSGDQSTVSFKTPTNRVFDKNGSIFTLNTAYEGLLLPCDAQSDAKQVPNEKTLKVQGEIGNQQETTVDAPESDIASDSEVINAIKNCILNIQKCVQVTRGLDTTVNLNYLRPGSRMAYAVTRGSKDIIDRLPDDVKPKYEQKLGWGGVNMPKVIRDKLDKGWDNSHAQTGANIDISVNASGQKGSASNTSSKWAGELAAFTDFQALECSHMPNQLHSAKNLKCKVTDAGIVQNQANGESYSNLSLESNNSPRYSDQKVENVPLQTAINNASNGKVPACILEGITLAEGTSLGNFSNPNSCTINACSAAGPFQLTTGWATYPYSGFPGSTPNGNNVIDDCRECNQNFTNRYNAWVSDPINNQKPSCPNALRDVGAQSTWPKPTTNISPCENGPAAEWALALLQLKAASHNQQLKNIPASQQREAIVQAANDYFGVSSPIERFGGISYGEFVYRHCEQSGSNQPSNNPSNSSKQSSTPSSGLGSITKTFSVMAIGDSLTKGEGTTRYQDQINEQLACKVDIQEYPGSDAGGFPNKTAGEIYNTISGTLDTVHPNVALILLGTNNAILNKNINGVGSEIQQIISGLPSTTTKIVSTIPPILSSCAEYRSRVPAVNASIQTVTSAIRVTPGYIDNNPNYYLPDASTSDCVHVNTEGNRIIAKAFANAIKNLSSYKQYCPNN